MKTLVILSGGMDSTTLMYDELAKAKENGNSIEAVSFNYGQRHSKELGFAEATCKKLGVSWTSIDLSHLKEILSGSALTSDSIDVPEGHYAADNMKATVVPNRNMIMLSIATGHAIVRGAHRVAYAAHFGDHAIYPDCRKEFADALGKAIALCDWSEMQLSRPYVEIDKTEIVRIGNKIGVPYEDTWSCYKGQELHCGNCGTCVERREAFALADVDDPTEYAPSARDLNDLLNEA